MTGKTGGRASRQKGDRTERALVGMFKEWGFDAERVPLSGAAGGSYTGDIICTDPDLGRMVCEVKARASGAGFVTLERWMGDNDMLILKRDRQTPMFVLSGALMERMVRHIANFGPEGASNEPV